MQYAADIVNDDYLTNGAAYPKLRRRMLTCLDELKKKYGEHPSILATQADYLDNTRSRLRLLKKAFEIANKMGDKPNPTFISESLAHLYIEELADIQNGKRWLSILAECLKNYSEEFEAEQLHRLKRQLKKLK